MYSLHKKGWLKFGVDVDRRAQASLLPSTVTYQENGVTCTATLTVQGEQPQVTPTPAPEVTDKPQVTQKPENVPQTGDDATVTLYVVTLAASLALLGGAVVVHRRRQR